MTKDAYFEMCELLGSEAIEEEIPVEYDDLVPEVQDAIRIYNCLADLWDYMNGNYIGKNLANFKDILDLYEIDPSDRKFIFEQVAHIDRIRSKAIRDAKPKT